MFMKPLVMPNLIIVYNPNVKLNIIPHTLQTGPIQTSLNNNLPLTPITNEPTIVKTENIDKESEIYDNKQTCKHCGKVFDTLWKLKDHVNRDEKLYYCHHCENTNKFSKQELMDHCQSVGIDYNKKSFFENAKKYSIGKNRTCRFCGIVFKTISDLYHHLAFEEKIYFCHHCEKPTKITKQELIDHCMSVRIDYNRRGFFQDAMKPSIDKNTTCKYCGTIYNTQSDLNHHLTCEEKIYLCHHCEKPTKITKQELMEHCESVGINYNKKNFFRKARNENARKEGPCLLYCEICSAEFDNKTEIEQHYEEFHKDHYKCEVCDEGFKKILEYIFHMKTHSEDNLYKCALCSFSTPSRTLVNAHLKTTHDQFMNYRCKVCGKGFAIVSFFQEHTKYFHTGERPFQCDRCGKKFLYSRYLRIHLAGVHNDGAAADVKCRVCGKSFSTFSLLRKHRIKEHRKKINVVCEVCGKSFDKQSLLSLHSKTHSDEKTFGCSFCEKKFRSKYFAVIHERVHTGEKPHICSHCGKGFSQRSSMVIHTRRHTGERPYPCNRCDKAYASKNLLTNHQKSCKGCPP